MKKAYMYALVYGPALLSLYVLTEPNDGALNALLFSPIVAVLTGFTIFVIGCAMVALEDDNEPCRKGLWQIGKMKHDRARWQSFLMNWGARVAYLITIGTLVYLGYFWAALGWCAYWGMSAFTTAAIKGTDAFEAGYEGESWEEYNREPTMDEVEAAIKEVLNRN